MEVKVLSKKLIKPSIPTPHNLRNFKISFMDQLLVQNYVHVILYYPAASGGEYSITSVSDQRRKRLEQSLSEILTFYYPLAGRYDSNNLRIDCNDEGVEFLEANVSCKLSQVVDGEFDVEQLNHLIPFQYSESSSSPLLVTQFNMFECGGTAIGISLTHRVVDGFTLASFLTGWATASREGMNKVDRPSFEFSFLFPARSKPDQVNSSTATPTKNEEVSSSSAIPLKQEDKACTKRFVFSGKAIKRLKASAAGHSGRQFSRVEVVSALIGKVLILVSQALCRKWRPTVLTHTINLRHKVPITIPDNCFGNFAAIATVDIVADEESKVQVHDIAGKFHDSVRGKVMECSTSNPEELSLILGSQLKCEGDLFMFSSWCRFPMYQVDFGWGKPTWVSLAHILFPNLIYFTDSKDGDGIEVFMRLEEDKMLLFQQHPDIIAFTSQ